MTVLVPDINEGDLKKFALALNQIAAGRSNATGTVTLTQNSATTVVTTREGLVSPATTTPSGVAIPASRIGLTATTAAAATEAGSGNMYVSSVGKDTFTITHTNSATAGRTFAWSIHG